MDLSNLWYCLYLLAEPYTSTFQPQYVDGLLNPSHRILSFTTEPCKGKYLHLQSFFIIGGIPWWPTPTTTYSLFIYLHHNISTNFTFDLISYVKYMAMTYHFVSPIRNDLLPLSYRGDLVECISILFSPLGVTNNLVMITLTLLVLTLAIPRYGTCYSWKWHISTCDHFPMISSHVDTSRMTLHESHWKNT